MGTAAGYKAFISHSHQDAKWAARLQQRLESFSLPGDKKAKHPLRPVFVDRSELASSPNLSDAINEALAASDALVVVCSRAAAQSKWVNNEILFYKGLGRTRIFPIIVGSEPDSASPIDDCMPPALRFEASTDGQLTDIPAEPLAADARRNHDGKDAQLKLIAGLLDIPFDSLKLRQHRRDKHRALTVAGGSLAMLLLTSYLAVTANFAQQQAELHRDQAEGLISYMLSDLRDQLEPVGRLDVLDGVGQQALNYFSSLNDSDLTGETLLNRATALRQIGEVRVAQGQFSQALVAFHEALEIMTSSINSNEPRSIFELGQINYWIADSYFRNLQYGIAQQYIEKYLQISRQLVDLAPDNSDYRIELLYAESNLGTLAYRVNDIARARQYFGNALAISRQLVSDEPSPQALYELADTVSWLGTLEASSGNFLAAQAWYDEQLSLRRALLADSPDPADRHLLGRALYLAADVSHQLGNASAAIAALTESMGLYRELTSYDPQNERWRRELAWTSTLLVRESFAAGLMTADEARHTLNLAGQELSSLEDRSIPDQRRVLANIDIESARIELLENSPELALELSQSASHQLLELLTEEDRLRLLPLYARANYLAAEAAGLLGDANAARSIAGSALAEIAGKPDDPFETRVFASLLAFIATGPHDAALLADLADSAYRAKPYVPGTPTAAWWEATVSNQLQ